MLAAQRGGWRRHAGLLVSLGAIGLLSAALLLLPIDLQVLTRYGYAGVFFFTLVATAALIAPAPYLAVIALAGTVLDPTLVALTAGVAAAIGEFTGYLIGRTGRGVLPQTRWTARLERAMLRYGPLCILLVNIVPNPIIDAMGMIAGASRMSVPLFVGATFLGKTLRFLLLAHGALWFATRAAG